MDNPGLASCCNLASSQEDAADFIDPEVRQGSWQTRSGEKSPGVHGLNLPSLSCHVQHAWLLHATVRGELLEKQFGRQQELLISRQLQESLIS